jgi:peptide/nickel transport system substrate-binding protein
VSDGTADVMWDQPTFEQIASIRATRPEQLHEHSRASTSYVWMNTSKPPFNDVRVRQAFNYAADRRQMARAARGDLLGGHITCQLIPPDFPGYQRQCPYTLSPSDSGRWTAPDLDKARQLVAESGTKGAKITLLTIGGFPPGFAQSAVATLRTLGYRVHLRFVNPNRYFGSTPLNKIANGGFGAWAADYVAASNFVNTMVACEQIPTGNNPGQFCDRTINTAIHHALQLQAVDPGAAAAEWTEVELDVVEAAPYVAVANADYANYVSRRVGNYQAAPEWGLLVDQLWVK